MALARELEIQVAFDGRPFVRKNAENHGVAQRAVGVTGVVAQDTVLPGAEPSDVVKSFGTLKPDALPLVDIAANRKKASELVDKVGLNDGPTE